MPTRRIGILGYDDVQALDVIGPSDAFTAVPPDPITGRPQYEVVILGLNGRTFTTESGIVMRAQMSLPAPRLRLYSCSPPITGSPTFSKAAWDWKSRRAKISLCPPATSSAKAPTCSRSAMSISAIP